MKITAETEVLKIFEECSGKSDHHLAKMLSRSIRGIKAEFGDKEVAQTLAEMQPFFEDSPSVFLRSILLRHYEEHHNSPLKKSLIEKFNNDNVLVFKDDSKVMVVHSNNKSFSRETYPIQVSKWDTNRGVVGDSLHKTIDEAIQENNLMLLSMVPDADIPALEDVIVEAESRYQERRKELTGEYCLS